MRQARLSIDEHQFAHTITRIVGREFLLKDLEREHFWILIQDYSNFTGFAS